MGDVNGDSRDDLLVGVPNSNLISAGGGAVGFFTDIDGSEQYLSDADLLLKGSHSAGALGTAMALGGDAD